MTNYRMACLGAVASVVMIGGTALAETRAVIELFTSQGCSSCPPADALLAKYSNDPTLIALSLAVDYWDYIGWKDTLALPGHERRQRAYARARGERQIYTPQVIVNGAQEAAGNDDASIEKAIATSRKDPQALSVPVTLGFADGKVTVSAPAGKTGGERGEVWLCPVARSVTVEIGRGENSGRTITYNNVVRRWIKLGDWAGTPGTWSAALKDVQTKGVDEMAVFIQAGTAATPGPMLAAAMAKIP